jgi:hypothetical protein
MTDIVHFEKIWEQAETLSSQTHKNATFPSILDELKVVLQDIRENMQSSIDPDTKVSITKKLIGELLYIISAISVREDVDVYSALKEHMESLFK